MTAGFDLTHYAKYPAHNIGFHSGWVDGDIDTTSYFYLTRRRACAMSEVNTRALGKRKLPFFLKDDAGGETGLSSGAASLLFQAAGHVYKVKRAGYREGGVVLDAIKEKGFRADLLPHEVTEQTYYCVGGLLEHDEADREIRLGKELVELGLTLPQRPLVFYESARKLDRTSWGSLIFDVDSDFRCDELVMCVIVDFLTQHCRPEQVAIDLTTPSLVIHDISLTHASSVLASEYGDILAPMGRAIGGNYRKLHDAGYIRSIGNSWYGNDIVCADGRIGMCDLDGTFHRREIADAALVEQLQRVDLNANHTAMFMTLYPLKSSFFELVSNMMIRAFRQGYDEAAEVSLDVATLERLVSSYVNVAEDLQNP